MKRRETRGRRPAAAKAAPARPTARRSPAYARLAGLLAAAIVLALVGWWWFGRARSVQKDAIASHQAIEQAREMAKHKRFEPALAQFRRAAALAPIDAWQLHYLIGSTATQLSIQNTERTGLQVPATRSSLERVRLVDEALREYDTALALATTPTERALVLKTEAELYFVWGAMWEAFKTFEEARVAHPADSALVKRVRELQMLLMHPERFATTEEAMIKARSEQIASPDSTRSLPGTP